jgi:ABC-type hemin transport system substrate-binding protein
LKGFSGERGIRTPEPVTVNSFQDCRNRPLCHLSECKIKGMHAFSQKIILNPNFYYSKRKKSKNNSIESIVQLFYILSFCFQLNLDIIFCKKLLMHNAHLRIVCLVPSITALLHYLGVEEYIVGITKFCVHPKHLKQSITIVGGTKNVNIKKVMALQPSLVIANKEENVKAQVQIMGNLFTTIVTNVHNIPSALAMIATIGKAIGKARKANELVKAIQTSLQQIILPPKPIKCCYLIWKEPFITIGGDTYIHDVLKAMGFKNVFEKATRYPFTNVIEIEHLQPAIIFLSSEPYPFKQRHIAVLQQQFPTIPMVLIDGQICSWYGSHMLQIANYCSQLQQQLIQYR